jgi:hypothetical protein
MEVYHQVYQPQDVNEDFNDWVNFLIQEGYDLDEYTDEELLEAYYGDLDEANRGDDEVTSHMFTSAEHIKDAKKYRRQGSAFRGVLHPNDWNTQGEPIRQRQHRERRGVKTKGTGIREEVDLYDIISNYLVSEGFCESYEDADVIMANMSEEWRESIVEALVSPFKAPPRHGRSVDDMGALSPAMKAEKKRSQLEREQPGTRRQINQTRRARYLTDLFGAARQA